MLGQSTSMKALAMCGVVVAGFFMGVDQEGELSMIISERAVKETVMFLSHKISLREAHAARMQDMSNFSVSSPCSRI